MLKQQGLTLDGLKKRIRDQILVQRVTRRKVALRISVTEQEIDGYINANRDKLETGLTFEARHILFLPEAGAGGGRLGGGAQEGRAGLRAGEGRQGLRDAGQGVLGGSLGEGRRQPGHAQARRAHAGDRASHPPPPARRVVAADRSAVGYHLFHLDAKETLSGEALTQARSQIRDILYREKYDARLKEWLAEIRQRALIDIRL